VPEQKGLVSGNQGDEPPFEMLREVVLGLSGLDTFPLVETLDLLLLFDERCSNGVLHREEIRSDPAVAFRRAFELSAEDSSLCSVKTGMVSQGVSQPSGLVCIEEGQLSFCGY
jgi:hypothetical protein